MTERPRLLIHISNYTQTLEIMEKSPPVRMSLRPSTVVVHIVLETKVKFLIRAEIAPSFCFFFILTSGRSVPRSSFYLFFVRPRHLHCFVSFRVSSYYRDFESQLIFASLMYHGSGSLRCPDSTDDVIFRRLASTSAAALEQCMLAVPSAPSLTVTTCSALRAGAKSASGMLAPCLMGELLCQVIAPSSR